MVPLFGAAYAVPNKSTTILYWFRPPKTVLNPFANGKIQGFFNAFWVFFKYFSRQVLFSRTFQDSLVYSSTFQACANPAFAWKNASIIYLRNKETQQTLRVIESIQYDASF